MKKSALIIVILFIASISIVLGVGLPYYRREYVASNIENVGSKDEVIKEDAKKEGVEYRIQSVDDKNNDVKQDNDVKYDNDEKLKSKVKAYSVQGINPDTNGQEDEKVIANAKKNVSRGQMYNAMSVTTSSGSGGQAVYTSSNGTRITVIQGPGSKYLTNKSILLDIYYPTDVEKTLEIGNNNLGTLSTEPGDFNYVIRVRDNVVVKAGGETFNQIDNFVKITTGCRVEDNNQIGYVKNKTYYSARLGGIITNSKGAGFSTSNVKEIGVRYWRSDKDGEIFTVKNSMGSGNNDNFKILENDANTLRFEILARSLKENTTYYMQAYMINAYDEVLLGDVKEFATRSQGVGLYGLYYDSKSATNPVVVKQETVDTMKFEGLNRKKIKWVGEIVPINNGVMKFKTITNAGSGKIVISNNTTDIYKGYSSSDSTVDVLSFNSSGVATDNIYEAGKKYKIIIEAEGAGSSNISNFTLMWKEDNAFQEVPKTQLYPKEYIKIASAVVNSVGTAKQAIGSDVKLINKKVITNGQKMASMSIAYANDVASSVTIGSKTYKILKENDSGYRVGDALPSDNNLCTIEGWIVYNTNDVVEPIIENVASINYSSNPSKVTLRNGSEWTLYTDVDIVGRVVVRKRDGSEVYDVYDLGRYIKENTTQLSDGKTYSGESVVYRTDEVDETRVVNLTQSLQESDTYHKVLNQYSTMEHFVEDSKPVSAKWNLGIGEGRVFSLVPIRMLISFDGDEQFEMTDPVIKISKDLYRIKNGATAKDGENVLHPDSKDTVFKLDFPTDVKKKKDQKRLVESLKYADWRYMNGTGKTENSQKHMVRMEDDGDYITITLKDLKVSKEAKDDAGKTNIMLNFVVRLDSIENKTSDEVFAPLYLINDSYKTFTEVSISGMNNGSSKVKVVRLPIEIKVKPQVTFE